MSGRGFFSGWTTRLWRRKQLAPGVRLNLSKSGLSVSLGVKGGHVTYGPRGTTETIGIPGTGAYLQRRTPNSGQSVHANAGEPAALVGDPATRLEELVEAIQVVIVDELEATRAAALQRLDEGELADDIYAAWGRSSAITLSACRTEIQERRGYVAEADSFLQLLDDGVLEFLSAASLFGQDDFDDGIAQLKHAHERWQTVAAEIRRITGQG